MAIRALRKWIAKIAIAAVLFTQLAVAAYACPALTHPDGGMPAAMMEHMDGAMPGCEQPDIGNPNLCVQHCQAGSQSVQTTPQVSIPAVVLMPFGILEPVHPALGAGVAVMSVLPERETSPPPLIRFRFLRI